jgi:transcriptional regulator NrdR family protein
MLCPNCNTKLKTVNSRKTNSGYSTWRRKKCLNCNLIFSSREIIDLSNILYIDSTPYSRQSLTSSISKLISRSSEEFTLSIVDTIESKLIKLNQKSDTKHKHISQKNLDEIVISTLEKLDQTAFLRYKAEIEDRN